MDFSIGDRVRVIGQEIVGTVSGFNGRMVVLDDDDAETTDVKLEFYEDQLTLHIDDDDDDDDDEVADEIDWSRRHKDSA